MTWLVLRMLRDYQEQGVADIRSSFAVGHKAPLYVAPTGSGKTILFSYIAKAAAKKGVTVHILVHRQELLYQTSKALKADGVDHGVIARSSNWSGGHVHVASVQTLARRLDKVRPPGLIIIDEAHHAKAKTWMDVIKAFPRARVLGVTATPIRLDGKGLGEVFDDMIVGPSTAELINQGHLSKYSLFAPPGRIDLQGVKKRMGDYVRSDLAEMADKPTITGDAIKHYQKYCVGQPAIAFCTTVEHANHVAEAFRYQGVRSATIDGKMKPADRKRLVDDLASGQVQVMTSCELVSEGFDLPTLKAAILLRPTKSLSIYLQQVGRALRPSPGKGEAIILDHAGNAFEHGLPDAPRLWELMPDKFKGSNVGSSIQATQCPKCYFVYEPVPACPKCGYVRPMAERMLEEVAGDLEKVEITPEEFDRRRKLNQVKKATSREDLERIAKERGYKQGWVDHKLRTKGQARARHTQTSRSSYS